MNILNQRYVATNDYSDVVTLNDIFIRYMQINNTIKGFEEYVESGFFNGLEKEYDAINMIAEQVCINVAFDIMRKEIDTYMTDCKFRVNAYQNVYNHLEHERIFVFVIHDEETARAYSDINAINMEYLVAYYITYTIDEAFVIEKNEGK